MKNSITVSIPYFRCKPYIRRAVRSILAQDSPDLRVVVVNDGDNVVPWDELADIDDPRLVRFDLKANRGCFFAHAAVLGATPDPYFAIQDADDWSEPERLSRSLECLRQDESDGVVSALWHHLPTDGMVVTQIETHLPGTRPLSPKLEYRGGLVGLFKSEALRRVGGCYAGFRTSYDKLLFNLLLMTAKISYIDESLYHRVIRPGSLTTSEATGLGSPDWLGVQPELQALYTRAFEQYSRFLSGRLTIEELAGRIRQICYGALTREEQKELLEATDRLSRLLQEHPLTVSTTGPAPPRRYRCTDVIVFPFGDGFDLVYCRGKRDAKILPTSVAVLMSRCREFDTIRNHALNRCRDLKLQALSSGSPASPTSFRSRLLGRLRTHAESHRDRLALDPLLVEAVAKQLSELSESGFLVSDVELIEHCKDSRDATNTPGAIPSIAIPTCSRPDALERALTSYVENCKHYGRVASFVVMDDSRSPGDAGRNRQLLTTLKRRYGMELLYAGREERVRFVETLVRSSGLPSEVVHFALLGMEDGGISTGACRNALLLQTAGDLCLQVDDDSVCRLAAPPETRPGLALTSSQDPTEFWFFPDSDAALRSVTFVEKDFLGLHEQLLGKDLAGCLASIDDAGAFDVDHLEVQHDAVLRSRRGRVLMTSAGMVGDSGMGSAVYLFMQPNSHMRVTRSEAGYLAAVTSRQILRAVTRTTISPEAMTMSFNLGLDNRALLPPFLPVQRNSDGVFNVLLRRCFHHAFAGLVPWSLLHAPPESRSQPLDQLWKELAGVAFGDIVIQLIYSFPESLDGLDEKTCLRRVGRHLADLGSSPLADFEEYLRIRFWQGAGLRLLQIQRSLEDPGMKAHFLTKYRQKYWEIVREALPKKEYIVPQDLLSRYAAEEARRLSQRLVCRFGELLQVWPDIVEAAKNLRARGISVAKPV